MKIEEQERIIEAATPEPWAWRPRADGSKFADGTRACEVTIADRTILAYDVGEPEARFIAAARTEWPEALRKLKAVREALDNCPNCGGLRCEVVTPESTPPGPPCIFCSPILAVLEGED